MGRIVTLGAHRLPPAPGASREERLLRSREMLAHALCQGTVVAVVGSGSSTPLGYPTWQGFAADLVERALEALEAGEATGLGSGRRERLMRLKARLEIPRRVGSEELMFAIGVCKEILGGDSAEGNAYHRYLEDHFRPPERAKDVEHNPHRTLLELPIRRFVTTNYDCEIERALSAKRDIAWEAFGIGMPVEGSRTLNQRLSFTQRPENPDQLALFALAGVGAAENMVFHCHGRFDDPGSIVATELDYQRWYLAEEGEAAPAFLQTFDVLFNSNPILFVGFGLGEEDLLRPLRRIAASAPERRQFRPLFALVPEAAGGDDWDRHERFFERYGLNVIPFSAPAAADPQVWGQVLCAELARLEEDRRRWQDGWFEKPMLRRVTVQARPPQPYRHYSVDPKDHETLGPKRVAAELERLRKAALGEARVVVLVGPGGTGKSWHAMRLIETLQHDPGGFEGFFFWSSYYADDLITGVDRLLGYIDPQGDRTVSRLVRLRNCLARSRHLVVLDGFERLLRPTDDPDLGRSNDPITRRLLEIFAEPASCSTLVLTTRLWPRDLGSEAPGIAKHTLERMRTDDIADVEPFSRFGRAEVSALCSLLEGHAYALFMAGRLLRVSSPDEMGERLLELRRSLASAHPDRRLSAMIDLAVAALDRETGGLARALLERLAVFMSPVTEATVELCFALADEVTKYRQDGGRSVQEVLELLLGGGLVFKVAAGPTESDPSAYTVHPTVRSYVFHQAEEIGSDVLPNFTLAGLTSSRAAVHPGSPETAALVSQLFDRLHREALEQLGAGRTAVARELCRSLFGIMRSRMETNSAPRWTSYSNYIHFGLKVADLAKRTSPELWAFREPHELEEIERPAAPLFADELAFVYNDVGLTLGSEGYMQDTLAVWEEGYEINSLIEGTTEMPLYSLQSQLHLGHTFLEIGNLQMADQYLDEARRTNHKVQDRDYSGRILGYQALVKHYRGDLEQADVTYGDALREIRRAGGNPRAQSYFLSHRAKLMMVLGRLDKADQYVRSSRAQAATGHANDLVAYARTASGRLYREQRSFAASNSEYHAALAEARSLGIRRLEAEILTGLSRLALSLGDTALARRRAMAALGIANELGLGLRKTQSLLLLGMATVEAGQPQLGAAYLRLAKRLGEQQGYWLRSREAEEQLQKLGEEPAGGGASVRRGGGGGSRG